MMNESIEIIKRKLPLEPVEDRAEKILPSIRVGERFLVPLFEELSQVRQLASCSKMLEVQDASQFRRLVEGHNQ